MTTSPEKWETVKALFGVALELGASERSAFLRKNCPDDEARAEVERLLNEHDQAGSFLSTPMLGDFPLAAEAPTQELSESQLLAGRFRVVRFIAGGGMGEVYEAEDQELRERVAIKTIRPEILAQPYSMARFKREVHLARKVTHPNVCRIFDLFHHQPNDGSVQKETFFISMELLRGRTLSSRLREGGRMSVGEALPLVRQMASALAAAHAVGIVHRDFKPANVVLVGVPGQETERAVVTDFGLALQSLVSDEESSISTGQGFVGTPAYMSPEQIEGRPATIASDIYALGLVIYEMVTGARPFRGDTPLSAAMKRLSETPRRFEPGLSQLWESVILRCLERDPSKRFPNAERVAEALTGEGPILFRIGVRKIGKRPGTAVLALVLLIAVLIGAGLYYRAHQGKHLTDTDTVVLADFANSTGDPVFDDTLKQALSMTLKQSPFLNILSEDRVAATLKLMTRQANMQLTENVVEEVCQRSGSKAYIGGSITNFGKEYVISLNAVNCESGEVLVQEQATASAKEKVLDALNSAAKRLRGRLGESLASVRRYDVPLDQATTSSLDALRLFSLAGKTEMEKGTPAALPLFERALELDPDFAQAYSAVGDAYFNLGQQARAKDYMTKAFELREHTSELERMHISSSYYLVVTGELEKAVQTYHQWIEIYPRDYVPYGNLAVVQEILGQYEQALESSTHALLLKSNNIIDRENTADSFRNLNRLSDARKTLEDALAQKLDDDVIHLLLYSMDFVESNAKGMAEQGGWFEGRPEIEHEILELEAETAAYGGHLGNARQLTRRAMESAERADNKEAEALVQSIGALREVLFGFSDQARRKAAAALSLAPSNREVGGISALVYALAGETRRARAVARDLDKHFPVDTMIQYYWLPTIRSQIALDARDAALAIEQLQTAAPIEFGGATNACGYPVYVRGLAYQANKQSNQAAVEFQKLLEHRGSVSNCPTGALARLGLARAYAVHKDTARTRAAYQDFLSLWKDADPDIPILKEAKAEYAKLQ